MKITSCSSLVAVLLLVGLATASIAAPPTFTDAQAASGEEAYNQHCASCHGRDLSGSHLAPALVETRFDFSWRGKSTDILAYHVRRMPPVTETETVVLSDEQHTNVLAYLLKTNGLEAGDTALPSNMAQLAKAKIPKLPGAKVDPDAPVKPTRRQSIRLGRLSPVTAEMLADPPPGDWLGWGRASAGLNHSPLTEINKETVGGLKLAWRASIREGLSMSMPLVHDGFLFIHSYPDTVLAMDASNGAVLWRHQYKPKGGSTQKLGISMHGENILVPTSDLHVIALAAKTGELVWDHEIKPEVKLNAGPGGHQLRSSPLVAGDVIVQGVTTSFASRGGFIVGLDAKDGKELWRFNTIARPGEEGGNTWNDVPLDRRSGGSVWHQGTYDPELNLVYYGVAPTYDTGPLLKPVDKEGVTNDALFTNCTIALNPKTGELVWYYQHMANDQWDLDWAFERQITTLPFKGEERKVVMNVGKMAIVEALDAATGEYLFSVDPGTQNVITDIDKETGAKTFDPDKMPDPEKATVVCPSAGGGRSWPPTSYSPETKFLYIPITESCMLLSKQGARLLTSGVGILPADHPDASDGKLGRLQAIDVAYQEPAWRYDQEAPLSTGVLATGGGVVFTGDLEPSLKAFDDKTGELLWRTRLDDVPAPTSSPTPWTTNST